MFWWPAILRLRRANRCVAGDDDCNVYTHCPQTKRPHTPPPGSMCTPHQTRIKCLFQIEIANVRIWQNCHHWHFQLFRLHKRNFVFNNTESISSLLLKLAACCCLLAAGECGFHVSFQWTCFDKINDFVGAKRTDFICMISGNGTQMDAMQFLVVVACFLWGGGAADISGFRERERERHTMGDFILISFRDIFHHCIENAFRQLFQ